MRPSEQKLSGNLIPALWKPIMNYLSRTACFARVGGLAMLLYGGPEGSLAGEVYNHIRASTVLRVGTTGDYKPYTFRKSDGSFEGADITMATRLAEHLHLKVVFVPTTWKSLVADFEAGKFDIAMGGVSILPEREAVGTFSLPVQVDGKRPIARCADKDRFTSVEAIDKPTVTVIVNHGGTNESFAHSNFHNAHLIVSPTNVDVTENIVEGRADVMVTDGVEVDHIASRHPQLCAAKVSAPFTTLQKAYLLPKDEAMRADVNAWLSDELSSGRWSELLMTEQRKP
jgi:cyclohexadienyl dehydratase